MRVFKILLVIGIALMMLAGCGDTEQAKQSPEKVNYAEEWDKKEQERKEAEDYFKKYPFLKDGLGSDTLHYSTIKKIADGEGLSLEEYAQNRLETIQKADEAKKRDRENNGINKSTCERAEKAIKYIEENKDSEEKINNQTIRANREARWTYDKCKKQGLLN